MECSKPREWDLAFEHDGLKTYRTSERRKIIDKMISISGETSRLQMILAVTVNHSFSRSLLGDRHLLGHPLSSADHSST